MHLDAWGPLHRRLTAMRSQAIRGLIGAPPWARTAAKQCARLEAEYTAALTFAEELRTTPVHQTAYREGTITLLLRRPPRELRRSSVERRSVVTPVQDAHSRRSSGELGRSRIPTDHL